MGTAPTEKKSDYLSNIESDDLTAITGIGPARQRWLRKALNIYTYRDLAGLSVDDVESGLKAEGQIVARAEIERWIAQAYELAAATDLTPRRILTAKAAEPESAAQSPTNRGEWQPFASFVVEYQARQVAPGQPEESRTTVHYMEADKGETWPGIEGEQLCQWMLRQATQKLESQFPSKEPVEEPLVVEPTAKAEAVAPIPVTLKVAQLRAFQPVRTHRPSAVGEAGQPCLGFIRGYDPFALEVSFELTGPAALETAKARRSYRTQFYAQNVSTRETMYLGNTEPGTLTEGKLSYTATLPEATLFPGVYRLRVIATLHGAPPVLGYLEVPLLQVT